MNFVFFFFLRLKLEKPIFEVWKWFPKSPAQPRVNGLLFRDFPLGPHGPRNFRLAGHVRSLCGSLHNHLATLERPKKANPPFFSCCSRLVCFFFAAFRSKTPFPPTIRKVSPSTRISVPPPSHFPLVLDGQIENLSPANGRVTGHFLAKINERGGPSPVPFLFFRENFQPTDKNVSDEAMGRNSLPAAGTLPRPHSPVHFPTVCKSA